MAAKTQSKANTIGSQISQRLGWALLAAALPLALAGCGGGGGFNPAGPAVSAPALHSAASGTAAAAPSASPAPVPSDSQVVSARPITGDVGPTGNVTVSVDFPKQVAPDAPRQTLKLVSESQDTSK